MVNTISASERVALWERVSGPVDQDAVRLDFLRRARAPHPPFRVRLRGAAPRGRVSVPGMVRHHYLRPPPLMPARREHLRCHKGNKKNMAIEICLKTYLLIVFSSKLAIVGLHSHTWSLYK